MVVFMIFEEWELNEILKVLTDDLKHFNIKIKIKSLMQTSRNKRYTLRTTDWLSDAAKKRGKKK